MGARFEGGAKKLGMLPKGHHVRNRGTDQDQIVAKGNETREEDLFCQAFFTFDGGHPIIARNKRNV